MADMSSMTTDQVIEYLKGVYGGQQANLDRFLIDDANLQYQDYYNGSPVFNDTVRLTDVFDPSYEGGVYGAYYADINPDGTFGDPYFQKAERSGSWFDENMDWIAPLVIGGVAVGMGGGLEGLLGAGSAETAALESVIGGADGLGGYAAGTGAAGGAGAAAAGAAAGGSGAATAGGIDYVTGMATGAPLAGTALGTSGATSALADLATGLGGATGIGSALGAGLGLVSSLTSPDSKTELKNNKLDPRMDAWVFGGGGLLDKLNAEINRGPMPGLQGAFNIASNYLTGTGASGSAGRPGLLNTTYTPWAR